MSYSEFHGIRALSAVDAFVIAASTGHLKEMRLLLQDGVPIDALASYKPASALSGAAGAGVLKSVNWLLERGAAVDRLDGNGMTPLMTACHLGKKKGTEVAFRLLDAGADVHFVQPGEFMTPLMYAVSAGPAALIQRLIDAGAAVDGVPGAPLTPLMKGARCNNVEALRVLINNGADPTRTCGLPWADHRTALGLAQLEKQRKAAAYLASISPPTP